MTETFAEYLIEDFEFDHNTENAPFKIDTQEKAIWALRKIALIEKRRAEALETARKEIERIKSWVDKQNTDADENRAYFDMQLQEYGDGLRKEDPKLKTIKLPLGDLKFTKQQPLFTQDEEKLLAWAKLQNDETFVKVTEKPVWAEIKKRSIVQGDKVIDTATGVIIEGVTAEERADKFSVVLKEG